MSKPNGQDAEAIVEAVGRHAPSSKLKDEISPLPSNEPPPKSKYSTDTGEDASSLSRELGPIKPSHDDQEDNYEGKPTDEEIQTLRRVSGSISWSLYTITFAELCERFSYYGSAVLYTNFVQRPLPDGSMTGAPTDPREGIPGALGMGQRAAQGINLFNQFFAYLMPLVGAWIADAKLGRYKTIHIAIGVSTIAHVILTVASIPEVLEKNKASFGAFIVGLLLLCTGTGLFKANISPLLAEQNKDTRMRVEWRPSHKRGMKDTGERVIVDPAITNARIFLWFYFCINAGSTAGQVCMVFVEKYHSFWLAFLLPSILFLFCPLVLALNKKRYHLTPPTGSVLEKFFRLCLFTKKHSNSSQDGSSFSSWPPPSSFSPPPSSSWKSFLFKMDWEVAKPSNVPIEQRPAWMTYDDAWVDQVKRGLLACKVFLFLPVFWLAYNQMTGNLTSQAATLQLHGAPNDVIQNLNPLSIIIMVPILDTLVYPGLRKMGFAFTPLKRMAVGFFFAAASMVAACVMQAYIYRLSPCGDRANECAERGLKAPINVWAQCLPYILVGLSEILTNVSSYEYAFAKAPDNMKSLVMSVNLFMVAISSAIGQAWTPLSGDPLLVWNYGSIAVVSFVGGVAFWLCFRGLDKKEDELNMLKETEFIGRNEPYVTVVRSGRGGGDEREKV